MVYRIILPQRTSNIVRRRRLKGMTSLNSISCLERIVNIVMPAIILSDEEDTDWLSEN